MAALGSLACPQTTPINVRTEKIDIGPIIVICYFLIVVMLCSGPRKPPFDRQLTASGGVPVYHGLWCNPVLGGLGAPPVTRPPVVR